MLSRSFVLVQIVKVLLIAIVLGTVGCSPLGNQKESSQSTVVQGNEQKRSRNNQVIQPGEIKAEIQFSKEGLFAKLENVSEINLAHKPTREANGHFKLTFWKSGAAEGSAPVALAANPMVLVGPSYARCRGCYVPVSNITSVPDTEEGHHYYLKDLVLDQPGPTKLWIKLMDSNSPNAKELDEARCDI